MYYVYILLSKKDNKFYIGFTADLKKRLLAHKNGQVASTKLRNPLELVMYEAYKVKQDAILREKFFKTTKGKAQIRKQIKTYLSEVLP